MMKLVKTLVEACGFFVEAESADEALRVCQLAGLEGRARRRYHPIPEKGAFAPFIERDGLWVEVIVDREARVIGTAAQDEEDVVCSDLDGNEIGRFMRHCELAEYLIV